jgi:glycosyltransferase involved in cell wall biosynthesis
MIVYKQTLVIKIKILIKKTLNSIINFFLMLYYLPLEIMNYHFNKSAKHSIRIRFSNFWPIVSRVPRSWASISKFLQTFKGDRIPCKVVKYYKPDIQYFSVFGKKTDIIKSKTKWKIFFTVENTGKNSLLRDDSYFGNCVDVVALSMATNFLTEETPNNYIRIVNFLYDYFSPLDSKDDIKRTLNSFKNKYCKTKFCSLIARHDITNIRRPMYDLVTKIAPVDCPSKFLHNDDSLYKQYSNDKIKYLEQYKFNICPENTRSPGYVSEKIFEALYTGCAPIYAGWSNDPEPGIINPNIILFFDPDSDNGSLEQEIKKLYENEKLYNSFMDQEYFMDTAVDKIYAMLQAYNEKMAEIVEKCIEEKRL